MSRLFRTSVVSRERNRVHAQRTRQRKKEQMQGLQAQVNILKQEQLRLRQLINEQNTANILVGIFARNSTSEENSSDNPIVEELLRRPAEEIPDASKIPELPALILPGFQASKRSRVVGVSNYRQELPGMDGIDCELLERDRAECTPQELDKIRRERNRMHAKRTRDRKRLFTEKLAEMSRVLQEENETLREHLTMIDPDGALITDIPEGTCPSISSAESSCSGVSSIEASPKFLSSDVTHPEMSPICLSSSFADSRSGVPDSAPRKKDAISTLLKAAGCFEQQESERYESHLTTVSVSGTSVCDTSSEFGDNDPGDSEPTWSKRRRLSTDIPYSVTTSKC